GQVAAVRITPPERVDDALSAALAVLRGQRGKMVLARVSWVGLQPVDHLVVACALDHGAGTTHRAPPDNTLSSHALSTLLTTGTLSSCEALGVVVDAEVLDDALDEAVFVDAEAVTARAHARFERLMAQIERYVEDRIVVQRRKRV